MPLSAEAQDKWTLYREAVLRVYEGSGGRPELRSDVEPEDLAAVALAADDLAGELLGGLSLLRRGSEDSAEMQDALIATAALDAAVGADVLEMYREGAPEIEVSADLSDLYSSVPWPKELESVNLLISRIDEAFGEGMRVIAGATALRSSPEARGGRAVDEIVECAARPAEAFAKGAMNAGLGSLIAAVGGIPDLERLASEAVDKAGIGTRLINLAVKKLVELIVSDTGREIGADLLLERWEEAVQAPIRRLSGVLLEIVVGAPKAKHKLATMPHQLHPSNMDDYDAELTALCSRYEKLMRSARTIAKYLRKAAPAMIVAGAIFLGGPTGAIALGAANGAGLAYCLFGAADRLDTVPGWVLGVPSIMEKHLAMPRQFNV